MKYECDLIRDLIPLVKDGIASEKSKVAVTSHIDECPACRGEYAADTGIALPPLNESAVTEIAQVTLYKTRVKKRRKIIALIVTLICFILVAITCLATVFAVKLMAGHSYTTRSISEYGEWSGHIEVEKEGFFTTLDIFPKELPSSAAVDDYYYFCNNGLLDNSYQIYLVCSYNQDDFSAEKDRLHSLELSYKDEVHTPIITDTGFEYPAVVTMFGNQDSFEYALLDDETKTIVYVYAQSMGIKKSVVPKKHRPQGFKPPEDLLTEWGAYSFYLFKFDEFAYVTPGIDNVC